MKRMTRSWEALLLLSVGLLSVGLLSGVAGAREPQAVPTVKTLHFDNGLTVMLREDHSVPLVAVELRSRAGAIFDPAGKAGLARLTAASLMYGTQTRSQDQITDDLARLGALLSTSAGKETIAVSGSVPTIDPAALKGLLEIMADVVLRPSFPEEDFQRGRARALAGLKNMVDHKAALAGRAFRQLLYGQHAYGRSSSGTVTSVASLKPTDARAYRSAHLVPQTSVIGVVGDFETGPMVARLRALFGTAAWPKGATQSDPFEGLEPVAIKGIKVLLVDTGDDTLNQAQIRAGFPLKRRYQDAGWHALMMASQVLGGDFTARLNRRLRIEEGLTYGARWNSAWDDQLPGPGYLSTYTSPKDVVKALRIAREELTRIRDEAVPQEELERVRQRIVRGFVFRFETAAKVLGEHMDLWQERLPLAHISRYNERLEALTPADLKAVATTDIGPDNLDIVVVGNQALKADLAAYAKEIGGTFQVVKLDWLGL